MMSAEWVVFVQHATARTAERVERRVARELSPVFHERLGLDALRAVWDVRESGRAARWFDQFLEA